MDGARARTKVENTVNHRATHYDTNKMRPGIYFHKFKGNSRRPVSFEMVAQYIVAELLTVVFAVFTPWLPFSVGIIFLHWISGCIITQILYLNGSPTFRLLY